jgi:hypothetical protein
MECCVDRGRLAESRWKQDMRARRAEEEDRVARAREGVRALDAEEAPGAGWFSMAREREDAPAARSAAPPRANGTTNGMSGTTRA